MQHTWKKLLALVLALMLCVSLLPAAYAEGDLGVLEPVEEAEEGEEGLIEPVNGDESEPEPEPEPAEEAIAIPSSGKLPRERHTGPVAPAATGDELLETQSGTCGDNLTWTLDDSGVLTISGTGEMESYGWGGAPWYDYSDQIQSAVIKSGVTLIGTCAFYNCYAMKSVSLPASLTDINSNAFCRSGLVSVTIPANVSYIGNYAFDACYSLEKISVSSSNTTFKSVSGALLTKDGTKLVRYPCAKTGSYTIPTGVTVIGDSSFDNCSISKVTIPSSVITVEDYAFYCCYNLSEVIFKGNAPSIEESCFYDVTAEVSYPLNDDTWTEDVFQNYGGSLTWLPGGIHPPVLVTDPQDYACKEGVTASFSVEAEGDSLSYQWYYQKPGSSAWTAVSSASGKKATYSLTTALRHDGYRYKCVVSNPAGSVESASATLTIMVKPTITSQPQSITVMATQKASFAVEATGGALSYKWYYRTSSTASWTAVSAASGKTATYSLTAAERHNGYQYRCKVYNDAGYVYTKTVTLTVKPEIAKPVITTQPKNVTGTVGTAVSFTIKASGEELSYQWYYRQPGTSSWTAVSAASGKTAKYSLTPAARHNGYQYQCKVTNIAGTVTSKTVTLTLTGIAPVIVTQPKNATVKEGQQASFTVKAAGTELSYQWYYRTSSTGSWKAVSAASGKTATYSLTTAKRHNGYQYRCKITNPQGNVTSKTVTLTVTSPTTYRALLIGEVSFSPVCNRNWGDVILMRDMLAGINGPDGGSYTSVCEKDLDYEGIHQAIESAFAGACEDDVSLFFLATHGVVNVETGYYAGAVATYNDEQIPLPVLAEWLGAVPGKVIVLLGSCGSGAAVYPNGEGGELNFEELFNELAIQAFAEHDVVTKEYVPNLGEFRTSKFYVLTAAQHQESSLGHEDGDPANLFTEALVRGVNGTMPADVNGDKVVTLSELFNYIESDETIQYYQTLGYQHTQVYPENSSYQLFAAK